MKRRVGFVLIVLSLGLGACATKGMPPPRLPGSPPPPKPKPAVASAPAPVTTPDPAPPVPTPAPVPSPTPAAHRTAAPASSAIVRTALQLRGTPYRSGGTDPTGLDCSGLVTYVFGENGIPVPKGVREQFQVGRPVKREKLAPGDLLFFNTSGPSASHVGILVDEDAFIHAPNSSARVRVERLTDYWVRRFVGARRIVGR